MYKIKQTDGDDYIVNESHILSLKHLSSLVDISVKELLQETEQTKMKGYKVPVNFSEVKIPNPYLAGSQTNNTYIPQIYKINSEFNRLEFLAGLIDSNIIPIDNHANHYIFSHKSEKMCDDMVFLTRSLGFSAKKESQYQCCIYGKSLSDIPIRGSNTIKDLPKNNLMSGIEIEKLKIDNYYGFEIDGNKRFLLGDFTVTHNTTLVMKGVADALGLPFFHINGGGINDILELRGSDKVYRNSGPGLLFKYAIEAGCLNFVFYFDEADKVSNRSNEVMSYMIHLFDNTANSNLQDGYYKNLTFDFSKCLKFVSYNSRVDLGNVFGDRIQKFIIKDYNYKQKIQILKKIIVPRYLEHSGMKNNLVLNDEACERILSKQQIKEKGLRQTCRNVENLIKIIGTIFIMIDPEKKKVPDMSSVLKNIDTEKCQHVFSNIEFPLVVTSEMVDLLWYEPDENSNPGSMYI